MFVWIVFYHLISVTTDSGSGCCFKNLEEVWRKRLEEAWRSFKTLAATDSSCSGWFELRRTIQNLRPMGSLQNFDPDSPWWFIGTLQNIFRSWAINFSQSPRVVFWTSCAFPLKVSQDFFYRTPSCVFVVIVNVCLGFPAPGPWPPPPFLIKVSSSSTSS